jgi:rod shape-determining protein MreC
MRPGPDRALSRRDTALFLGCVILSVVMLLRPEWGQALTTGVRRSVLVPFLWLQADAERARTTRVNFDQIRLQRDSATQAAEFLPALRAENVRLRRLLGLGDRLPGAYVAAEVLHQSMPTDGRTIILSAGARDGVEAFDPVVGVEGLIGVVRTVEPSRSVAMTWAHPEFRASAFTLPGTIFGVVAPALQVTGSEQLLQLRGVAIRDSIPVGTLVVTSGLGGVYPPGIPVGTIVGLANEETGWERIYILRPAASPQAASQVIILRPPRNADLGEAFRRDSTP